MNRKERTYYKLEADIDHEMEKIRVAMIGEKDDDLVGDYYQELEELKARKDELYNLMLE